MRPELWDAKDGSIRALPEYEVTAEGVKVPLKLDELGSCFIVFRQNGITTSESKNYPEPTKVEAVDGEWNVAFEGKLSSHDDITLSTLVDLSKSDDKELRYFSGTMNYTTNLNIAESSERTVLDLGRVECMAKVYVNDTYAGGVWCEPFKVDISEYVKQGENTLRIEVVNKWVNRIVGDLQLPAEERKISLTANPYGAHSDIPASGLIGPVRVEQY